MKITRRFAVVSLLVIAMAVVLGAPAPASPGLISKIVKMRVKLYPAADSPLPHATGTVTVSGIWPGPADDAVSVSVSRLAPNASYYMPVTVQNTSSGTWGVVNVLIQTDSRGNGGGWFSRSPYYRIMTWSGQVYDSSGTLVLTSNP